MEVHNEGCENVLIEGLRYSDDTYCTNLHGFINL